MAVRLRFLVYNSIPSAQIVVNHSFASVLKSITLLKLRLRVHAPRSRAQKINPEANANLQHIWTCQLR